MRLYGSFVVLPLKYGSTMGLIWKNASRPRHDGGILLIATVIVTSGVSFFWSSGLLSGMAAIRPR